MPRVLVVSSEPLGGRMLGSAIRAYELARALTPYADVELACPDGGEAVELAVARTGAAHPGEPAPPALADAELPVTRFDRAHPHALRAPLARADFVIAQPPWPHVAALLRGSGARLIFDLYDPEPLENLELLAGRRTVVRRAVSTLTLDRFAAALRDGDHLMCASETQRALYLGMLLRRLTPAAYDADPTLRSRLDVVPFGVPDAPFASSGPGPREVLGLEGEIVLWNGGVWPWLDAPTAIRAVRQLGRGTLVFMAGSASFGPARAALEEARRVAAGAPVVFHDGWVPYEQRAAWLAQAACAISTHRDHLETRFAFRTRLLDCFWAGLPVVATEGDDLAERVRRDELGETVRAGDVAGAAAALERVLDRGRAAYAPALASAAADLRWSRVVEPLVRWITEPLPRRAKRSAAPRDLAFRALVRVLPRWPTL